MDQIVRSGKPHEIVDAVMCGRCLGTTVTAIRELPAPTSTSYALRHLMLDLADGRTLDVFQKNYDISPHAPDVALSRGRRERYVYEHILSARELGTSELYGVRWDDSGGGHSLLLEFVHGRKLRRSLLEDRVAAAAWLGRLRGSVVGCEVEFAQSGLLLRYDEVYFWDTAERALQAVGARFGSLLQRLERVLTGYEAVIERFCSGEPTLVHGSYRPRNIIVVDTSATNVRICPADWELTGLGPPLHDFAFLADGADRRWIERMWESYVAAAAASGHTVVQPDEMFEEIEGLRLHKALRSLARSADWDYPGDMVTKIVAKAEMIGHGLR